MGPSQNKDSNVTLFNLRMTSTFDYKAFQIYLHFRVTSSFRPLSISNLSKFDGCRGENNKHCTFLEIRYIETI